MPQSGVSSGVSWNCFSERYDAFRYAMGIATKGT
jgi:hypothetical protein